MTGYKRTSCFWSEAEPLPTTQIRQPAPQKGVRASCRHHYIGEMTRQAPSWIQSCSPRRFQFDGMWHRWCRGCHRDSWQRYLRLSAQMPPLRKQGSHSFSCRGQSVLLYHLQSGIWHYSPCHCSGFRWLFPQSG